MAQAVTFRAFGAETPEFSHGLYREVVLTSWDRSLYQGQVLKLHRYRELGTR